jgi:hypothetical protein
MTFNKFFNNFLGPTEELLTASKNIKQNSDVKNERPEASKLNI